MGKARKILARRNAIKSIHTVTRTMEMVSTARFKQAFKRSAAAGKYIEGISQLVENIIERCDAEHLRHPLIVPRRSCDNHVVLVLASDRGLCSGYNLSIVRAGITRIKELQDEGKTVTLHASGRKGIRLLQNAKHQVAETHPTLDSESGSWHSVSTLADAFMEQFLQNQISGVDVVYAKQLTTATYETTVAKILPLVLQENTAEVDADFDTNDDDPWENWHTKNAEADAQWAALQTKGAEADAEWAALGRDAFEFVPSSGLMLRRLLPTATRLRLFECFMDAAVTEQIARMAAMHAASENADDIISALNVKYNRTRQGQITTELAEILGGRVGLE